MKRHLNATLTIALWLVVAPSCQRMDSLQGDGGTGNADTDTDTDADSDSDSDADSDSAPTCSWQEVFPLGSDPLDVAFTALVRRSDGTLVAVNLRGDLIFIDGVDFVLELSTDTDFVALDATEDDAGTLFIGGYEGTVPEYNWWPLPIPYPFVGPPRMRRIADTDSGIEDLTGTNCDAVVGVQPGSAGTTMALCENGNVLRREGQAWVSLEADLVWGVGEPGDPGVDIDYFYGLWAGGPTNLFVYGMVVPTGSYVPYYGYVCRFDGAAWEPPVSG